MHAADAAGREDGDACQMRADHGGGYGGGAGASHGDGEGEIGAAEFHDIRGLRQRLKLRLLKADVDLAIEDRDCRWNGTLLADDSLNVTSSCHIGRVRHAMGDDGGFEPDDRTACVEGRCDFRRDMEHFRVHAGVR
jgi:hypothetical protein